MTSLEQSKVVRRKTVASVIHGVNPNLVITLYPRGVIGIRELRRRKEFCFDAGTLYVKALINEGMRKGGRK